MALFGLGTAEQATQVQVTWPDGRVRTLRNVTANQRLSVSPESAGTTATYRVVPVMSPIASLLMVLLLGLLAHRRIDRLARDQRSRI